MKKNHGSRIAVFLITFIIAIHFSSIFPASAQSVLVCDTTASETDITDLKNLGQTIDAAYFQIQKTYQKGGISSENLGNFSKLRDGWYESISQLNSARSNCEIFLTSYNDVVNQYNFFRSLFSRIRAPSLIGDSSKPQITMLDDAWTGKGFSNDAYVDSQYYIKDVQAQDYLNPMGTPVIVAVIDEGVYINHDDLRPNIWINQKEQVGNKVDDDGNGYTDDIYGYDFISNDAELTVRGSHGTSVGGIIGAVNSNYSGISGLGGNVKIMSLIACSDEGCPIDSVLRAIRYAADNGAKVINLSLGTSGTTAYTTAYNDVIRYAYSKGVVIVAAAGNGDVEGSNGQNLDIIPQSPVCNDNGGNMVLGVSAYDPIWRRISWANYGKCVDAYAPGAFIFSTSVPAVSGFAYSFVDGTSFSAPIASALAAQLFEKYPNATPDEIINLIKNNLDDGEINFKKALSAPFIPKTSVIPPQIVTPTSILHSYNPTSERDNALTISQDKGIFNVGSTLCTARSLIKGTLSAVYYCGDDGKRYVFPSSGTYFTWYKDFSNVIQVSDSQVASIQIGGNVTYRPGTKMIKIVSSPLVYAVSKGGTLHAITSEAVAIALFGVNWNKMIDDIPDAFFTNYRLGDPIY